MFYADNRLDVQWATYSVLGAYIENLKMIAKIAPQNYVFSLSGQDYPVKPNEFIYDFVAQNPDIEKYYNRCYCPDELMFQTLILNQADLKEKVKNNCLKYIDWSGIRGELPLTFTIEEQNEIASAIKTPLYFLLANSIPAKTL